MERDNIKQLDTVIKEIAKPWVDSDLPLPRIGVLELSRVSQLPLETVVGIVNSGKLVVNSTIPAQEAVLVSPIATLKKGKVYNRAASKIWSEGQRYERRFQFQPRNAKGRPTKVRIEALAKKAKISRLKVDFRNPVKVDETMINTREIGRWLTKSIRTKESQVISILRSDSFAPIQNLMRLTELIKTRDETNKPLRFACFICLPGEWVLKDNQLKYQILPQTASREIYENLLVKRTKKLIQRLEESGVNFTWDFLIADTDIEDVFGDYLLNPQDKAWVVNQFQERLRIRLAFFSPEKIDIKRWSEIRNLEISQYQADFQESKKDQRVQAEINDRYPRRVEWYKKSFASKGITLTQEQVDILAKEAPLRNRALYAAEGPILLRNFDCLAIADKEPTRLAEYQSLLAPRLIIWFPYRI